MKPNHIASVLTFTGFVLLCACQTDADREHDSQRLRELGALPIASFCADPTLSEAKKIANRGNGLAGVLIATCYEQGIGVPADNNQAMKWFRQAQNAGYTPAAHHIESLKTCIAAREPAQQGDPKHASVLADCFENGKGGPRDIIEARKWDLLAGPANERPTINYQLTAEQEAEAQRRFTASRPK